MLDYQSVHALQTPTNFKGPVWAKGFQGPSHVSLFPRLEGEILGFLGHTDI